MKITEAKYIPDSSTENLFWTVTYILYSLTFFPSLSLRVEENDLKQKSIITSVNKIKSLCSQPFWFAIKVYLFVSILSRVYLVKAD